MATSDGTARTIAAARAPRQCVLYVANEHGWLAEERGPTPRKTERWRAEFWAHKRPRGIKSGHQLHFDSAGMRLSTHSMRRISRACCVCSKRTECGGPCASTMTDEGRGGVRNPVISSVLYLSDARDSRGRQTAPTLITHLRKRDNGRLRLDNEGGVLVYPRRNRVAIFRGDLLHGVMPTVDATADEGADERVTLMTAFWRVGDGDCNGDGAGGSNDSHNEGERGSSDGRGGTLSAAMPLPSQRIRGSGDWTEYLAPVSDCLVSQNGARRSVCLNSDDADDKRAVQESLLFPIKRVWSPVAVGSASAPRTEQLPEYGSCFQGQ